uniref:G_PROTEIN_RECEP_F1_2 domain-containing protein n=1 Tax=Ascaris lumbricoides TaxID=6252 RepID=A0A0M3I5T3_ASCLU
MLCRFTRVENAATVEENNASIHLSFNTLAAAICLITSIFLLSALLVICIHPIAYKTMHLSENYSAFQMGSEEYICLVCLFASSSMALMDQIWCQYSH